MNLTSFLNKYIFKIMSIILIVCVINQIYMLTKYNNISKETFFITLFFTGICVFWGFLKNMRSK